MPGKSSIEGQPLQRVNGNSSEIKQNQTFRERGMYSSITIENFRLFDHLELDDLANVNLFFGPNNCGKTSILEAVYTHACGLSFRPFQEQIVLRRRRGTNIGLIITSMGALDLGEQLMSIFRERSLPPYTFAISAMVARDTSEHKLKSIFHPSSELADLDPRSLGQFSGSSSPEFELSSQLPVNRAQLADQQFPAQVYSVFLGKWQTQLNQETHEVDINFPLRSTQSAQPFKLASMHDILTHRDPNSEIRVFSYLKRYVMLNEFVEEMRNAFPEICEIDFVPYPDATQGVVYVTIDGQQVPLYVCGDGMRRWFYLLGYMLVHKNAAHCIEEIDVSFHPDTHRDLSRLLIRYAAEYRNQLFLTSHSIEFTDAFLEALYGEGGKLASIGEDPVRVFTIRPTKDYGRPEIWKLTGREAYKNRSYYDLELR